MSEPSSWYRRHRFPSAIHQPRRLLVLPIRGQLPGCGRDARLTPASGLPANDSPLVPEVWAALCRGNPAPTTAPRDRWHLDEMHLRIGGRTFYLWRAVDADGMVLDIVLQERRNQEAAETLLQPSDGVNKAIVTAYAGHR